MKHTDTKLNGDKFIFAVLIPTKKEGNVLFNDTLNTFYLRLYDVRYGKGPLG